MPLFAAIHALHYFKHIRITFSRKMALFGRLNESPPPAKRRRIYNANAPEMIPYTDDIDPVWYDWDCTQTELGNYVRADAPEPLPNQTSFPREVVHSMRELLERPGIYAWILFSDHSFAAARTFSPQEILSKHKNLHRNRSNLMILAAGECRIREGRQVEFNLLSGTYMVHILRQFNRHFPRVNGTDWYAGQIRRLWEEAGAESVDFTTRDIISKIVTEDTLRTYSDIGYAFQRFPTQDACRASKNQWGGRSRPSRSPSRSRSRRSSPNSPSRVRHHRKTRRHPK
jgi:hypothetical protein